MPSKVSWVKKHTYFGGFPYISRTTQLPNVHMRHMIMHCIVLLCTDKAKVEVAPQQWADVGICRWFVLSCSSFITSFQVLTSLLSLVVAILVSIQYCGAVKHCNISTVQVLEEGSVLVSDKVRTVFEMANLLWSRSNGLTASSSHAVKVLPCRSSPLSWRITSE